MRTFNAESEMIGERPGKHKAINYERDMVGEKPKKKAFKEGGHVKKMAMGGVAKIRHKEATSAGKPINKKVVKGK